MEEPKKSKMVPLREDPSVPQNLDDIIGTRESREAAIRAHQEENQNTSAFSKRKKAFSLGILAAGLGLSIGAPLMYSALPYQYTVEGWGATQHRSSIDGSTIFWMKGDSKTGSILDDDKNSRGFMPEPSKIFYNIQCDEPANTNTEESNTVSVSNSNKMDPNSVFLDIGGNLNKIGEYPVVEDGGYPSDVTIEKPYLDGEPFSILPETEQMFNVAECSRAVITDSEGNPKELVAISNSQSNSEQQPIVQPSRDSNVEIKYFSGTSDSPSEWNILLRPIESDHNGESGAPLTINS